MLVVRRNIYACSFSNPTIGIWFLLSTIVVSYRNKISNFFWIFKNWFFFFQTMNSLGPGKFKKNQSHQSLGTLIIKMWKCQTGFGHPGQIILQKINTKTLRLVSNVPWVLGFTNGCLVVVVLLRIHHSSVSAIGTNSQICGRIINARYAVLYYITLPVAKFQQVRVHPLHPF